MTHDGVRLDARNAQQIYTLLSAVSNVLSCRPPADWVRLGGEFGREGAGEVAAAAAAPLGVGNVASSEGLVTMARAGWGDGIQPQVASWCGCGVSTMIGHFPSTDR